MSINIAKDVNVDTLRAVGASRTRDLDLTFNDLRESDKVMTRQQNLNRVQDEKIATLRDQGIDIGREMNIDTDEATPSENLTVTNDGKYLFRSNTGDFDIDRFNLFYEQYNDKRKKVQRSRIRAKLDELNKPIPKMPIYDDKIGKIFIDMKDSIFDTMDDILQGKFTFNTFTKNNRLFYLGFVLVLIVIFLYAYTIVIQESYGPKTPEFYVSVNHIHTLDQQVANKLFS